ncbi:T9SS type A sorting domain-containing protein [Paraflavisolibacter sp. H34]|uniref:T9SS type A sorting domain-containing protein n=1 Tax=Huijunlia imazamoxiresistens TaxID=3127457 RepID=UPI00301B4D99
MKVPFLTFLLLFLHACGLSQSSGRMKIPVDGARWYQVNFTTGSLNKLFDGDKSSVAFTGWNKILNPYEAYYPVLQGEAMTIDSVRMYDKEGIFTGAPMYLYALNDKWEKTLVATFEGLYYNSWVGPYPDKQKTFRLKTPVTNIRYLMLLINGNNFPGEIELYGTYTPPVAKSPVPQPPRLPLKAQFGINGFAWDLLDGYKPYNVEPHKMNALKSFSALRQYIDWEKMEPVEGRYYFSPQAGGGWCLDTMYQRLQEEGIELLATFQNLPPWIVETYPETLRAKDNNPARYGSDLTQPASYTEMARLGFQFAARYGRNKAVDPSLVSVYSVPQWTGQLVNTKKIGLGLVRYIECGNEVDKNWRGRKAYLSAREYAANLSAFYDGHKGKLGANAGVKTADPTMQVVMTGIASGSPDYFRAIIDWCREFRGLKPDGSVDLCFDVINYHYYASNQNYETGAVATRGVAPELSVGMKLAQQFVQAAHLYADNLPVWITELGYDVHPNSVFRAIAVGNRTVLETQADWTLRSALMYAREGLQMAYHYQVYDFNVTSSVKFASMGLINKSDFTRKPAADFLYQTGKLFGNYTFVKTLKSNPYVDRYEGEGKTMYALVVPDEVGRTAVYELDLGNADSAIIYKPVVGAADMQGRRVPTKAGRLWLTVTETPQFVVPLGGSGGPGNSPRVRSEALQSPQEAAAEQVTAYPNPVRDRLFIRGTGSGQLRCVLTNMRGEKMLELLVTGGAGALDMSRLSRGVYALTVTENNNPVLSRLVIKE